jgi:hypothetical protein
MLALVHEVDLYQKWVPFLEVPLFRSIKSSHFLSFNVVTLKQESSVVHSDKFRKAVYLRASLPWPIAPRDTVPFSDYLRW